MASIKVENYKAIADFYAAAQSQVIGVADYYFRAAEEIVLLQAFDPELDLLSPFYNAYLAANTIYSSAPASIIGAVRVLQDHVIARARTEDGNTFTDINDWLDAGDTNGELAGGAGNGSASVGRSGDEDGSFTVPRTFADMSAQAGYDIAAGNID